MDLLKYDSHLQKVDGIKWTHATLSIDVEFNHIKNYKSYCFESGELID